MPDEGRDSPDVADTGVGFREAGPASGLAVRTVQRLVVDHADTLSGLKAILAREMAVVAVKARQAVSERLDLVLEDPQDLAVVMGISQDKTNALAGGPLTNIEHESELSLAEAAAEGQAVRDRLAARNRPA
jgi:hypothetical protein